MDTLITAHSGCDGTPDNSLEFVKHALSCGVDAFEIDVCCRDGRLFMSHDTTDLECPGLDEGIYNITSPVPGMVMALR